MARQVWIRTLLSPTRKGLFVLEEIVINQIDSPLSPFFSEDLDSGSPLPHKEI